MTLLKIQVQWHTNPRAAVVPVSAVGLDAPLLRPVLAYMGESIEEQNLPADRRADRKGSIKMCQVTQWTEV
jgi:hypothetical protein